MCVTGIVSFGGSRIDTSFSRSFTHLCVVGSMQRGEDSLQKIHLSLHQAHPHDGPQAISLRSELLCLLARLLPDICLQAK